MIAIRMFFRSSRAVAEIPLLRIWTIGARAKLRKVSLCILEMNERLCELSCPLKNRVASRNQLW